MFEKYLNSIEDVQNHLRGCWKHYEENVEYGMDLREALDQAYGTNQGVISVLTTETYNAVFSDEFRKEWEDWRHRMLFGE